MVGVQINLTERRFDRDGGRARNSLEQVAYDRGEIRIQGYETHIRCIVETAMNAGDRRNPALRLQQRRFCFLGLQRIDLQPDHGGNQ